MSESENNFNLIWVRNSINNILKHIEYLISNGNTDSFDIELNIMEKYPEFYEKHPFLVKKMCKQEDLSILNVMLNELENIEKGNKTLSGVELKLGEELANTFLYPSLNKNKFNK
jgi:hypothetical protein